MTIRPWNIAVYQYIPMLSDVYINGTNAFGHKIKIIFSAGVP